MKYWPLRTRKNSPQRAYLFLDKRGLGTLHIDRHKALAAMREIQRGGLPEGAVLFPTHQLLRVRSHLHSTCVTARLHQGKTRRFELCSVVDRDRFFRHLREHPAVKISTIKTTPLLEHSVRQVALYVILGGLFWMSYQTALTTSGGKHLESQLSIVRWGDSPIPALPYVVGVVLLLAAVYRLRQSRSSRQVEEVLFV